MEDRGIVLGEAFGDLFFQVDGLDAGFFQRTFQAFKLEFRVRPVFIKDVGKAEAFIENMCRARRQSGISDGPAQDGLLLFALLFLFVVEEGRPRLLQFHGDMARFFLFLADGVEEACIDDNGRNLKSNGGEGADLFIGKSAGFFCLDDNNADRIFAVEEGDTEKGVVAFFAGLFEITITRMIVRLRDGDYTAFFDSKTG